jgi:hypothetical protein
MRGAPVDESALVALQLVKESTSSSADRRSDARAELKALVGLFPTNVNYLGAYALALALGGLCHEARRAALALEGLDRGTRHTVEYTLAQVYFFCGDPITARRHADRSLQLAESPEDHQDAYNLLDQIDNSSSP